MAALAGASPGTLSSVANVPTEQEQEGGHGGGAAGPSPNHNLRLAMWPTDTDLVFAPGTNRLMLTHQYPPVRAIMQDAFENVRAYLLFDHSFPDAISIPVAIRTCLLSATMESLNPRAVDIHGRLTKDFEYMDRLSYLVSVS